MTKDRYLIWPICIAVEVPFSFALVQSFCSDISILDILGVLMTLSYLTVATGVLCFSIYSPWHGRWRSGLSSAAFPLLIACFIVRPATLIWFISASDYVHYFAPHDVYQAKVDIAHDPKELRLIWFYWRDASGLSGQTLVYLVYDESDELARPSVRRSPAWNARARDTFLEQTQQDASTKISGDVHHLFGHYYVVYIVF